jgi:hypothetical protein
MKKYTHILFAMLVLITVIGCKTQIQYVPVESVKIEYQDKWMRDSIYLQDSILIKEKGDTVWIEKYKYLYRDKIIRDSVLIVDSVQIPYPVEVEKRVNYISGWQNFQIWFGRILLILIIVFILYKIKK